MVDGSPRYTLPQRNLRTGKGPPELRIRYEHFSEPQWVLTHGPRKEKDRKDLYVCRNI